MPRTTRNSQDCQDVPAVTTVPVTSVVFTPTSSSSSEPSQELIASVVEAVQAPISSMVWAALLSAGIGGSVLSGASAQLGNLEAQATGLGQIGGVPPWAPSSTLPSSLSSPGRPLTVPTFMSTFAHCIPSTSSVSSLGQTVFPPIRSLANSGRRCNHLYLPNSHSLSGLAITQFHSK